jgi:hypothetical protein
VNGRSPLARPSWLLRALRTPRRPQSLTVLLLLAACAGLLLWFAKHMGNYGENLALNLGTDIVGVVITVFVIGPLISRAQEGRVREHTRLDYEWFSAQVYGSTSNVKVLDTFSNLFGPQYLRTPLPRHQVRHRARRPGTDPAPGPRLPRRHPARP